MSAPFHRVSKGLALDSGIDALGHRILGCSRDQEALETLARDCSDRVSVQAVDVRDDAAVAAWIQSAVEEAGAPDLLINNAAIINPNVPCGIWMPRPLTGHRYQYQRSAKCHAACPASHD